MLEQEVRRQAMLQVMGLEVWLPRQALPYAPAPRPELLNFQPPLTDDLQKPVSQPPAKAVEQQAAPVSVASAPVPAAADNVQASLQQVRQSLDAVAAPAPASASIELPEAPPGVSAVVTHADIPRFSLQLLRSGPCLLLADLPLGEAFQSSDPDFQLLKDILRAARLSHEPQLLRQGEPIRWPLLNAGQLAGTQDSAAARACVRDLLEFECSREPVKFVWLLGPRAVCFANIAEDAEADLFSLTAFQAGARLWNLPSLEQLMSDKPLKPQLWYHLQKLMPHWSTDA